MADYSELSKQDLNAVLCEACFNGNLDLIKEIFSITGAKKCNNIIPKNMVTIAAQQGQFDIIKYLLVSDELNSIITPKFKKYILKDAFIEACSQGHLSIVDYLLNLSELNLPNKRDTIENGFYGACSNGQVNVIDYLFNQSQLTLKSNFPVFEYGTTLAVRGGYINVLKYFFDSNTEFALKTLKNSTILFAVESHNKIAVLQHLLTSPDFKNKFNIHDEHDIIYKCAHNGNMTNVLHYLIIDFNIEKTKDIENHLKVLPNEEIEKMFDFHDLVNNLQTNETKVRQPKI